MASVKKKKVFIPFLVLTCTEFYFLQLAVYNNTNFNACTNHIVIPQCRFYLSLFTAAVLAHVGFLYNKAAVLGETIKQTSCIMVIIIIISL